MKEKRRNTSYPGTDTSLYDYGLKYLWQNGFFDEYDHNHFMIQVIENNPKTFDRLKRYCDAVTQYGSNKTGFNENFCINFEARLQTMVDVFGKVPIEEFIKGQFAAGKKHYNESQFFEALSEVEILLYFACFGPGKAKGIYEPKTGKGNHNPEATFEYSTGDIISIEVKTPEFQLANHTKDTFMPLYLLNEEGLKEFEKVCVQKGCTFKRPRVSKLKSFMESACEKFDVPKNDEYNILCINWTYTDIEMQGFIEPTMLLYNPVNGIFNHMEMAAKLSISEEIYEKISAIFIFQNSIDAIQFLDLRYLWAGVPRKATMLLNPFILDTEFKRNEFYRKIQIRPNDFGVNFDMSMYFDTVHRPSALTLSCLNKIINEKHI